MVSEKDAAKKRVQARKDAEEQRKKELEDNTLGYRWYVCEYTPGYNTGGYYDTDVPSKSVVVSDYFDKRDDAVKWMDRHEADKGSELRIGRQRLLRRTWTEWVNY